ncbi:MAG: hypothetical protein EDS66_17560 [Planctomycetota bacterium]|nr:MAG: hypothetical protein EDS66_17560 [Planctomycetota bacterium]
MQDDRRAAADSIPSRPACCAAGFGTIQYLTKVLQRKKTILFLPALKLLRRCLKIDPPLQ